MSSSVNGTSPLAVNGFDAAALNAFASSSPSLNAFAAAAGTDLWPDCCPTGSPPRGLTARTSLRSFPC